MEALHADATILNPVAVEDIMVKDDEVSGLVVNWTAVERAHLHVDPLTMETAAVIDSCGHEAGVSHMLVKLKLNTSTGDLLGEGAVWAKRSEEFVVEHTGEIYPNVYAAGMSVCAVFGGNREDEPRRVP